MFPWRTRYPLSWVPIQPVPMLLLTPAERSPRRGGPEQENNNKSMQKLLIDTEHIVNLKNTNIDKTIAKTKRGGPDEQVLQLLSVICCHECYHWRLF